MKYFTLAKTNSARKEITKDEARNYLTGYWKEDFLDDLFGNGKAFRLYTLYREIWTKTDEGMVPVPGFYGVVEE